MKEKKHNGWSFALMAAIVLLLGVLLFAVFRIVTTLQEQSINQKANEQLARLAVTQMRMPQIEETMQPPSATETEITAHQSVPIPITVDFDVLKQENEDIVAWIYCSDTPIHYPVVQGQDNEFYLKHMVNGQWNPGGSIFLDCKNSKALTDDYSLIHGHNLQNDSMFGTLPRYREQAYYEEHKVLHVLTPEQNYVLELFAGFVTDSDDGLYTVSMTAQAREKLIESCIARSDFSSELRPAAEDRLLALSTCSYAYNDARYVVIGVLRENQAG